MQIPGTEKIIPVFRYVCLWMTASMLSGAVIADVNEDYQRGMSAYRAGDVVAAMAAFRTAADAGHPHAQALYGVILDAAELDDEAVAYLRKAADRNDPDGQYGLAKMLFNGEGVARDDVEGARLMRLSAAQGHERANIMLALAYISGDPRLGANDPTKPEASKFLLKAAELGDVTVIAAVIQAYREGRFGLGPDVAKAEEWEKRLAKLRGDDTRTGGRRK